MAMWRFSDGTTFEPPERVTGESKFAVELRYDLAAGPMWTPDVHPCAMAPVDFSDDVSVGQWLRNLARMHGVRIIAGADPPPVKFGPSEPGVLY